MITIFSTLKPFTKEPDITNQIRAVKSWTLLEPKPQVILIGKEKGVGRVAAKLGCLHCPEVDCNEWGTPKVYSLFAKAERHAVHDIMCIVNADIILFNDLLEATRIVAKAFERFVIVGLRFNLESSLVGVDVGEPGWQERLRETALAKGELKKNRGGSDYFVFPKGTFPKFPPVVFGTKRWDTWVMGNALRRGIPMIDATKDVLVVHQNHPQYPRKGTESQDNVAMVPPGSWANVYNATWVMKKGKMARRDSGD